jgi:hypothetical protein
VDPPAISEVTATAPPTATATATVTAEPTKPDAASPAHAEPLRVRRLVLARGVHEREPVDAATHFVAGKTQRIYAFVEIRNPTGQGDEVFVSFERRDASQPAGQIRLQVGAAPRWRTWAYTRNADKPGSYKAVVRDARGQVIAEAPFEVTS